MPRLSWTPEMEIGFYLIDEQHKDLMRLINGIYDTLDHGAPKDEVSKLIRRFFDYTMTHFRAEEALMDHATYPQYFTQVAEHLACSQKALEFHRRFVSDDHFDFREFLEYIVEWYVNHTTGIDRTLIPYLRAKGSLAGTG